MLASEHAFIYIAGMILEEAVMKCGGQDGFKSACARGDVWQSKSKCGKHTLYYMPQA